MKQALQTQKDQADFLAKKLGIPTFNHLLDVVEEDFIRSREKVCQKK